MTQPDTVCETKSVADHQSVITINHSQTEADVTIKKLQSLGSRQKRLSVVGRVYVMEKNDDDYYTVADRSKCWVSTEAFRALFVKGLIGSALVLIPGIGLLVMVGPVVAKIVRAFEGGFVQDGQNLLCAGLYGPGFYQESIVGYEMALRDGKVLLIEHCCGAEWEQEEEISFEGNDRCDRYGHQL